MKKILLLLFVLFGLGVAVMLLPKGTNVVPYVDHNDYVYNTLDGNVSVRVSIDRTGNAKILNARIQLRDKKNGVELNVSEQLELVELEDNGLFYLPEQSFVYDQVNDQDYLCDSTFSGKKLAIGFEKDTKYRIYAVLKDTNPIEIFTLFKLGHSVSFCGDCRPRMHGR